MIKRSLCLFWFCAALCLLGIGLGPVGAPAMSVVDSKHNLSASAILPSRRACCAATRSRGGTTESAQRMWMGRSCVRKTSAIPPDFGLPVAASSAPSSAVSASSCAAM